NRRRSAALTLLGQPRQPAILARRQMPVNGLPAIFRPLPRANLTAAARRPGVASGPARACAGRPRPAPAGQHVDGPKQGPGGGRRHHPVAVLVAAYPPLRAATSGHFVRQHGSTRLSWATPPNLLQKSYIFPTGSFHPTPVQGTLGLSLHSSLRLGRWLPPCHV